MTARGSKYLPIGRIPEWQLRACNKEVLLATGVPRSYYINDLANRPGSPYAGFRVRSECARTDASGRLVVDIYVTYTPPDAAQNRPAVERRPPIRDRVHADGGTIPKPVMFYENRRWHCYCFQCHLGSTAADSVTLALIAQEHDEYYHPEGHHE